jgi:hypothetical protein
MSTVLSLAVARKTSRCNLIAGWLVGGEVRCYNAPKPADSDTAITTQTLLVTFDIPDPAGTVTNGVFTCEDIEMALVAESGTAAWARCVDSSGNTIGDVDAGLTGTQNFLQLDNLTLVAGGYIAPSSFTIAEG